MISWEEAERILADTSNEVSRREENFLIYKGKDTWVEGGSNLPSKAFVILIIILALSMTKKCMFSIKLSIK